MLSFNRTLGILTGSLVAPFVLWGCGASSDSDQVPPSIILITLDTVRADCLGVYGGPEGATPVLDAFSDAADRHEFCVSAAPWTMPTHASLFTGLYPFEHGAHSFLPPDNAKGDNVFALADRFETLAEALAQRGYRTGGVVSNAVYLRPMLGLEQGFAAWEVQRSPAPEVNRRALEWLDQNSGGGRPTFLFINYMDAHRPYNTGDREDRPADQLDQLLLVVMGRGQQDPELSQRVEALHQEAVTRLDAELGKLFDGLKERGMFDRSMIIVTSDHGEAFGAHGIVEHSKDVYEDTVRVPLLVKLPGQKVGRVLRERASSIHVAGMIAAALEGTDAETLVDVFPRRPGGSGGPILSENYYSRLKDLKRYKERFKRRRWAQYEGNLKLIAGSDNSVELYDLEVDPGETQNLAPTREADAARLLVELQRRLGGPTAYQGERVLPGNLTESQQRDLMGHMRESGYAGDDEDDDVEKESR